MGEDDYFEVDGERVQIQYDIEPAVIKQDIPPEVDDTYEYWNENFGDIDPYKYDTKPTPKETPEEEYERDQYGEYNPNSGSQTPTPGRCNETLKHYESRYGEKRYCCQIPRKFRQRGGAPYCRHHAGRANRYMKVQELFEHGVHSETMKAFYSRVSPLEQLMAWRTYESLLEQSIHPFEVKYQSTCFHFDIDADEWREAYDYEKYIPPVVHENLNENGELHVEVPYVADEKFEDVAMALWNAAVDGVQMTRVNARLSEKHNESKTTSHAQLTAPPSEHDSTPQEFKTIEEWTEHHLNLVYSRLVRDRETLLEYGGVGIEEQTEMEEPGSVDYYDDPLAETPVKVERAE